MFVNENYKNYKYVVGVSDNYVILTNVRNVSASWDNPRTISIIYQYLTPSTLTIESTRNYTTSTTFSSIDTSQSFYARPDSLDIIKVQFLVIFFVVFVLNGLTRFVKKGGVFFGE